MVHFPLERPQTNICVFSAPIVQHNAGTESRQMLVKGLSSGK